jgi:diguanylate cyclase (GGDEF)-like protein
MKLPAWRTVIGPVITLSAVGGILLTDRFLFPIADPGAISFIAVIFSAYFGGIASGLVSAVISLGYALVYFSVPGSFLNFTQDNFARVMILIVTTPAGAVMVGILQARARQALQSERLGKQELLSMRAALDESDVGIVLLDRELRAQFINRAYRKIWRLPDEVADSKPAFVKLLYHARDTAAYGMSAKQIDSYIAERAALVRAGDEKPLDLRLANGEVIRFRCKALFDGGRMLNYGNVSDLVRHADELAELATVDGLTGIYNRRHFLKRLDGEWARYRRYGRPLSLLMLDIDHFKLVNDRFGHDVGDQVLAGMARACGKGKRESDTFARLGGEEFALLLPETTEEDACLVAERLRALIAEHSVPCGNRNVEITVSIGISTAEPEMNDASDLLKRADKALYAAKHNGRNQVASLAKGGIR